MEIPVCLEEYGFMPRFGRFTLRDGDMYLSTNIVLSDTVK
jgi:hypothetical protein